MSIGIEDLFVYSTLFTAVSFFTVGMIKGKVVNKIPIRSGLATLGIGGTAALLAFIMGCLLCQYVL